MATFTRHGSAAVLAVAGLLIACAAGSAEPLLVQHGASARSVREHVDLKLVKKTGASSFVHAGRATGTIAGAVRSKITLSHSVVLRGTVIVTTSAGKLRLKVDGRARSLGLRTRFNGTATFESGTGRYAHARGGGTFVGVVNRGTWHATIDASGSLTL